MKKLLLSLAFIVVTTVGYSQLFKPVPDFMSPKEKSDLMTKGHSVKDYEQPSWRWRFDASISIVELNYNTSTKKLLSNTFSAVGPAVGYQHYVPTSSTDPTPFNNYGVSAAILFGESVYEPDLASVKIAIVANVMQYLKFGLTITPKPAEDISVIGLFFGGGITF
jgi:hypothetical protein